MRAGGVCLPIITDSSGRNDSGNRDARGEDHAQSASHDENRAQNESDEGTHTGSDI